MFTYYIDLAGRGCQVSTMLKRGQFHHGDLRHALIEAGHCVLNERGLERLSLRDLAARVGVSQSAPYRHFKSKEALLQELIDGGLHELFLAYQGAASLEASPKERLRSACHAYLDFAEDRPGLFQLVFERDGAFNASSVKSSDDAPSFVLFLKMVKDVAPEFSDEMLLCAAISCWSTIHGFASLKCHAKMPKKIDDRSIKSLVVNAAINVILPK